MFGKWQESCLLPTEAKGRPRELLASQACAQASHEFGQRSNSAARVTTKRNTFPFHCLYAAQQRTDIGSETRFTRLFVYVENAALGRQSVALDEALENISRNTFQIARCITAGSKVRVQSLNLLRFLGRYRSGMPCELARVLLLHRD